MQEIQSRDEYIWVPDQLDCWRAPLPRFPFFSNKINGRVCTNWYSPHLEGSADWKKDQAHLAAIFNSIINNLKVRLLRMKELLNNYLHFHFSQKKLWYLCSQNIQVTLSGEYTEDDTRYCKTHKKWSHDLTLKSDSSCRSLSLQEKKSISGSFQPPCIPATQFI